MYKNNDETFIDLPDIQRHGTRVAILYPNDYYVAMSNLGFQGLFRQFVMYQEFSVNRFFYNNTALNHYYSPENHFALNQADIIFISHSYEVDFIYLIEMLLGNKIEPLAEKRSYPIICAGGAFPNLNPNIYLAVADILFRGEFEVYINQLLNVCFEWGKSNNFSKDVLKKKMMDEMGEFLDIKGVRNESAGFPIYDPLAYPNYTTILTNNTSFSNTFLLELTRGCRFKCRFCMVPWLYGKIRCFPKDKLFEKIELGLQYSRKIGLVSALTTEYPDLLELIEFINDRGGEAGFSSLRVDQLNDDLLNIIIQNSQNTLTIAPETAHPRLKNLIRKPINVSQLKSVYEKSLKKGIKRFKFYFIIGFEEEGVDEIEGIIQLIKELREISLQYAKELKYIPDMIINLNQFVPKPLTPLSAYPFEEKKNIEKKIQQLKKNLLPTGNISIKSDSLNESYIQWYLSHGDFRVGVDLVNEVRVTRSMSSIYRFFKKRKNDVCISNS